MSIPAAGGPAMPAIPRARVNRPKALASRCSPSKSHSMIDVKDINAAEIIKTCLNVFFMLDFFQAIKCKLVSKSNETFNKYKLQLISSVYVDVYMTTLKYI